MKNRPYQLTKDQVRWHLTDAQKNLAIKAALDILASPTADDRAKGIATKNLILMNGQNIQTVLDNDQAQAQNINIIIKEE